MGEHTIALFTILLTVATIVLAAATIKLWLSTDALVRGADDTAQKQLRAYVSATLATIGPFAADQKIKLEFVLANHGATPAHDVTFDGVMGFQPYPLPRAFDFPDVLGSGKSKRVIHPRASINSTAIIEGTFSQAQLDRANIGANARLYYFGRVTYRDIYEAHRETCFCLSLLPGVIANGPFPDQNTHTEDTDRFNTAS